MPSIITSNIMSRSDTYTWHFQVRSLSSFQRHIPENKDSRQNGMQRERSPSGSAALSVGNHMEKGEKVLKESERKEDIRRAWPTKLAKKIS